VSAAVAPPAVVGEALLPAHYYLYWVRLTRSASAPWQVTAFPSVALLLFLLRFHTSR